MLLFDSIKENKEFIRAIIAKHGSNANANKSLYDSEEVVNLFIPYCDLQKPEETIFAEFREKLHTMKMLDIGVGAGRTTVHFAGLAKEYLGIDCASNMIKAARKKFENYPQNISFVTMDASKMNLFKNNYFDFILFSWCGIDYAEHDVRLKILSEIHRVLKIGGFLAFQTHNLNYQLKNCSIELSKNPFILLPRINHLLQIRLLNNNDTWKTIRNSSGKKRYLIFRDETHNFRLITYIISPIEQIKQLTLLGFTDIRIFDLQNGKEIRNPNSTTDPWLYFVATKAV